MTKYESKMIEILKYLKLEIGVVAVKAEFEAEGTRVEELLRLLDVSRKAGLKIALKIGGCEAVRDLLESRSFGCDFIIAPMVETEYALQKFIQASKNLFHRARLSGIAQYRDVTAFQNRKAIVESAREKLDGVVFGRVDYVSSAGMSSIS